MSTTTRVTLLKRIQNTDNNTGWTEFVQIYTPVIINTIRRFRVEVNAVDDILQEVLLQMSKTLPKYRRDESKGRFRSYLRKVTENKVNDHWRKNHRHNACMNEVAEVAQQSSYDQIWDDELNRRISEIAIHRVREQTATLTWLCFARHVLDGANAQLVAEELGVTANAVYINSSRTMGRIRELSLKLKAEHCDEPH